MIKNLSENISLLQRKLLGELSLKIVKVLVRVYTGKQRKIKDSSYF